MKKITLLSLLLIATTIGFAQNLITNGTFDDATGWTTVNQYGTDSTNGSLSIAEGKVTIGKIDPLITDWIHIGFYTSVNLTPGWYQFDMDMAFDGIDANWGEVYIGTAQPVENTEYSGDKQVIKAYNAWDCDKTYTGKAVAFGCDTSSPGKFEITTAGTYYLLFRSGGSTFGNSGVSLDNFSLVATTEGAAPTPLTNFNFDFDSTTSIQPERLISYNDDAINAVTNGINSSINVGELTGVNNDWWSQIKIINEDGIDLSTGDRGFSIKVKGPRTSTLTIKVEDGGTGHEKTANYTTPNEWQKLTFDFSSFTSTNNKKIALFFDMQTNFDSAVDPSLDIFQIDDYVFGEFAFLNTTLSTEKFTSSKVKMYPNPVKSTLTIEAKSTIQKVSIYNVLGQEVLTASPKRNSATLQTSELNKGIYMVNTQVDGAISSSKIIKE